MKTQAYYKRIGYVSIQGNDGAMHSFGGGDGLDFKFVGEKIGSVYASFTVGVLGLSADTINALTTWNPAEAMAMSRRIEVHAGYDKGGIANPLFSGIIVEALPTSPPEMWLNINCLNIGVGGDYVKTPRSVMNTTVSGVFDEIASEIGLKARWIADADSGKEVSRFTIQGAIADVCEEFANTFGVTVYEESGILVCCNRRPQFGTPAAPIEVGIETGMISLPSVSLVGAKVRTRLKDDIPLMSWIRLKSEIIPKANGLYVVTKKKHVGHFRGDDWYTELETIRKGAQT